MPERRKVLMKVNELTSVDVNFISLVGNAANRSPFKILKSTEDDVHIDLRKLFPTVQKSDDTPAVAIASVIVKAEAENAAMDVITELGSTPVAKDTAEGYTTFTLIDGHVEGAVIKLDDTAAVVVTGVSKMFEDWPTDNDFITNVTKSGFYPALRMASGVLVGTVHNIMESVEKGASPVPDIENAIDQYKVYVSTMAKAIPVEAFKFEGLPITKAANEEDAPTPELDPKAIVAEQDQDGEPVVKDEDEQHTEGLDVDALAGIVLAKLTDSITGIVEKAVEPIQGVIKAEGETTAETMAGLISRIDKTDELLRGVICTDADADVTVVKDEPRKATFDDALVFDGFETTG